MSSLETIKQNKKFGYLVSVSLMALAVIRILFKHRYGYLLPGSGVILLLLTVLAPQWLTQIRWLWEKFGHILGVVNTYILLTLVYFLVLTPLSMAMRLFGKDILKLKRNKLNTYWENTSPITRSGMNNQF
ncbi:MAG: SxtJ family membrane protein [Bacteroidota bacterium]